MWKPGWHYEGTVVEVPVVQWRQTFSVGEISPWILTRPSRVIKIMTRNGKKSLANPRRPSHVSKIITWCRKNSNSCFQNTSLGIKRAIRSVVKDPVPRRCVLTINY